MRILSASARNYGDVSPVPRTATPNPSVGYPTPGACTHPAGGYPMPARPYPGSVRSGSGPPGRRVPSHRLGAARRVPIPGMGVARRLGSARGTWTYTANVYVIEFVSACTKPVWIGPACAEYRGRGSAPGRALALDRHDPRGPDRRPERLFLLQSPCQFGAALTHNARLSP